MRSGVMIWSAIRLACLTWIFGQSTYWAYAKHDREWAIIAAFFMVQFGGTLRETITLIKKARQSRLD